MITENNQELHETDKLYKKLITPSLGSCRLDSHIHQHHAPMKIGPVLLPYRSSSHGTPQASKSTHNVTQSLRTPPSTEMTLDDSFPRIGGGQVVTGSTAEYEDTFAHSHQAASGVNIRRQHSRAGSSLSSVSCTASVPWTFYSTTKMKQLPLPQVQSTELLLTSPPNPRGKRNVSVCSDRYLGTSRVGGGQPHHQRSKSAAEILHPISTSASSSDQVRRFEEERLALLQTRALRRTTERMAHRKDRKYHMCGSGVPIHDRYMVDSDEMHRLQQLIHARATKRGSSPVSYYGRYGVRVTSGIGTRQTELTSASVEQEEPQGNNIESTQIIVETNENENSVAIAIPVMKENEDSVDGEDKDDDLVAGYHERNEGDDEQEEMVEVAGNMVDIAKTDGKEECEELYGNDELDTLDGEAQAKSDPSLDANQPVEGAITTAVLDEEDKERIGSEEAEVTIEADKESGSDDVDIQEMQNVMLNVRISRMEKTKSGKDVKPKVRISRTEKNKSGKDVMPNVRISRTEKNKSGKDAFMTEFDSSEMTDDDLQEMFGNFKSTPRGSGSSLDASQKGNTQETPNQRTPGEPKPLTTKFETSEATNDDVQEMCSNIKSTPGGNGSSMDTSRGTAQETPNQETPGEPKPLTTKFETSEATNDDVQEMCSNIKSTPRGNGSSMDTSRGTTQETPNQETPGEPKPLTAEEALLGMTISNDKIAAMEDGLKKIDSLKGGIKNVGHLEESELDLDKLNTENPNVDYREEVFGKVLNDEELKNIERQRKENREARSAKARNADDSIMATAKLSQAKSKMADIYKFISPRQQEVFEKKFKELDIDGNGVITLQELFKRMYRGRDNKEMGRAFMQVFDLNKDQTIDECEFVIVAALNDKLMGKLTDTADAPLELNLEKLGQNIRAYKEIFEVTDQDADGRLTLEDIMLVIALSGNVESGVDPDVVQHVYNTIDADDNGTIDFKEYLTYIPFFLKLHKRMAQSRQITIAEVERARSAVRNAVLKVRGNKDATMTSF